MDQSARMVLAAGDMCALATSADNAPWVSLMAYVFEPERKSILMLTLSDTRKARNLQVNPNVGLLVDTRGDDAAVREGIMALSAAGTAEILQGGEADEARSRILEAHPHLARLAEGETEVLRVAITSHQLLRGPTTVVSREFSGE